MDDDVQIQLGLITKAFIINTIILFASSTLFLVFPDLFPEYWDVLAAITIISFTVEIILFIVLNKISKTENICEINGCENMVRINKNVCPQHDEEVVNAIRNNRIGGIIGLVLAAIIYFIMK